MAEAPASASATPPVRRGRWIVLVAALLTTALTARLGVWQMDRAAQKVALQTQLTQRSALPPVPQAELARTPEDATTQQARTVALTGRWLPQGTVYLENRQMRGRPGFFVVTPLLLAPGEAVLVQRGWLPRDLLDRTRVVPVATPGDVTVTLTGRIAPPPSRLYDFDGAASGPIRQNLDLASHARLLGLDLRPLSVLQTEAETPPAPEPAEAHPGLLRDWPVVAVDVSKHHGYAAQWFALSALSAVLYVWFQLIRPRFTRRQNAA